MLYEALSSTSLSRKCVMGQIGGSSPPAGFGVFADPFHGVHLGPLGSGILICGEEGRHG